MAEQPPPPPSLLSSLLSDTDQDLNAAKKPRPPRSAPEPQVGALVLGMHPEQLKFFASVVLPPEKVNNAINIVERARKKLGMNSCFPPDQFLSLVNFPGTNVSAQNGSHPSTSGAPALMPTPQNLAQTNLTTSNRVNGSHSSVVGAPFRLSTTPHHFQYNPYVPSTSEGVIDLSMCRVRNPNYREPQIPAHQNGTSKHKAPEPMLNIPVPRVRDPHTPKAPKLDAEAMDSQTSTSENSKVPKNPLTLLTIPDIVMQQVMERLTLEEQFSLRCVCTTFRDHLPLHIEFLKVHFSPVYCMVHISLHDGKRTVFEYKKFDGSTGPSTWFKKMSEKHFRPLMPGAPAIHVTNFLGRLLANGNLTLDSLDVDLSTCKDRDPGKNSIPQIEMFLNHLQAQMATRKTTIQLQYLSIDSIPQNMISPFVACFEVREFELNSEETIRNLNELTRTRAWKSMETITLGNAHSSPPIPSFVNCREVSLTLVKVTIDDLGSMREVFSYSTTIQKLEVFTQAIDHEMLLVAFPDTSPDIEDFGKTLLWVFPIQGTSNSLLVTFKSSEDSPEDQLCMARLL